MALLKGKPHPQSLREAQFIAEQLNARAAIDRSARLDADETVQLALQLEHLRMTPIEEIFQTLRARAIIPIGGGDIDSAAETFAQVYETEVGEAAVVENYGDDPPTVEEAVVKQAGNIIGFWMGWQYTLMDLRRAARTGRPLDSRKMVKARRAFERLLDTIAATGYPQRGIAKGMVNQTMGSSAGQIRNTAVADSTKWQDATRDPSDMLDDLNKAVREFTVDCDDNFVPRTLVLPDTHEAAVRQTRMSSLDTTTVLQAFLSANPQVKRVIPWRKLRGVDSSGTLDRGILLQDTVDVVELIIPQDAEVLPLENRGLSYRGVLHGRTGGVDIHQPLGMRYINNLPNSL